MPLAKTADIKTIMAWSGTEEDAVLALLLPAATAVASQLAGRPLEREVDRVEIVQPGNIAGIALYLERWPVESVKAIVELSAASTPAEFDAADALSLYADYIVSPTFARVENTGLAWSRVPGSIRVTYTAGYIDPETSVDAWAEDTAYAVGDLVSQSGEIYAALSAHTSTLANMPPSSQWALVHQAPQDLQYGIVQQVIRMYQTKESAGLREFVTSTGGGGVSMAEAKPHPALIAACDKLRRMRL